MPPEQARISVFDRGFLYGDSVYETLRAYAGRGFLVPAHLERLEGSASAIGIELPLTREQLAQEIARSVTASGETEAALRVIVTRGEGSIALVTSEAPRPNLVILVRPFEDFPERCYREGVGIVVATTVIRNAPRALDPNIKSGNYLNNILAAREAQRRGAFEAVMLTEDGLLTEGTTSNLFLVRGGRLLTPDDTAGLLRGITRRLVLHLGRQAGLEVEVRDLPVDELRQADEAFITSSLKGVMPVTRVDEQPVGDGKPGAVTLGLLERYRELLARFVAGGEEPSF